MVFTSFISSPQQKRAIGWPGSYLGSSPAVMVQGKTEVAHPSITDFSVMRKTSPKATNTFKPLRTCGAKSHIRFTSNSGHVRRN